MTARRTNRQGLHTAGIAPRGSASARWAVATLALSCCVPAWGQTLADPTRPPAAWLAAQAKAAPGTATAGGAEPESAPRLQSLLIGPSRKYAIIEGQLVGVGDTFKDARVVAVRPTEVVLRSERGTETLRLFPDVEKRAATPADAEAKRPPRKGPKQGDRRSIVIKETFVIKETK